MADTANMTRSGAASQADRATSSLRRRLLGAGLLGAAGALLSGRLASADDSTTTTAPPQRPTPDDIALLQFAQTVELAAVALYDVAIATGGMSDAIAATIAEARACHLAYGQSLAGILGTDAPGAAAGELVDAAREAFASGDDAATATAAHDLEDIAVATHTDLVGQLLGTNGAALLASVLVVEARMSLVFADLAGIDDLDTLLLTDGDPLSPAKG